MTNAPERIWIEGAVSNEVWKHDKQSCLSPHEYTRTDLIPAMIEEAVQAEREAIAAMFDEIAKDEDALSDNYRGGSNPWLRRIQAAKRYRGNAAAIRARKGGEA
jgi:rubrerythrin